MARQADINRRKVFGISGFLAAMLCVWCPSPEAQSGSNQPSAAARMIAERNSQIIAAMPGHPDSRAILEEVVELYGGDSDKDGNPHIGIARDFPDSNLGLYSLSVWLSEAGADDEPAARLERLARSLPETRLARFAFAQLIKRSDDAVAICEEFLASDEDSPLGLFVQRRLAETLLNEERTAEGLARYLRLYIQLRQRDPGQANAVAKTVTTELVRNGLPLEGAVFQVSSGSDSRLARSATAHLAELLGRMASMDESSESTPFKALFRACRTGAALDPFIETHKGTPAGDRAVLYRLARRLEGGVLDGADQQVEDSLQHIENADYSAEVRASLLADFACFLHIKRKALQSIERVVGIRQAMILAANSLEATVATIPAHGTSTDDVLWRAAYALLLMQNPDAALKAYGGLASSDSEPESRVDAHMRAADILATSWHAYEAAAAHAEQAFEIARPASEKAEIAEQAALYHYLAEDYAQGLHWVDKSSQQVMRDANLRYLQALIYMRQRAFLESRQALQGVMDHGPEEALASKARFLEAYTYFLDHAMAPAAEKFRAFKKEYPASPLARLADRTLAIAEEAAGMKPRTGGRLEPPSYAPNIILITLDTVRADALGCYGNGEVQTPNIDAIAARGTTYTSAYATSSWTKPTHASMFSGVYQSAHRASDANSLIPPGLPLVAEILQRKGYNTYGVVCAPPLHSEFGFARGFGIYDDVTTEADRSANLYRRIVGEKCANIGVVCGHTGSLVTDRAKDFVDDAVKQHRPFFLFVNFFDAHHNYEPLWRYGQSLYEANVPVDGNLHPWVERPSDLNAWLPPEAWQHMRALYNAEVMGVDQQVGELLEHLESTGLLENSIVCLVGDHGEEFYEHGGVQHGRSLYNEVIHVPMVLAGSGIKNTICDVPVSHVDVMPTFLDAAGIEIPAYVQGQSLLAESAPGKERYLFSELDIIQMQLAAVVGNEYKLIRNERAGTNELFQIDRDPSETSDLAESTPEKMQALADRLDAFQTRNAQLHQAFSSAGAGPAAGPSKELREQLRALGYAHGE